MESVISARAKTILRRTVLAVATVTACAGASAALPQFTFNPNAVGLEGTGFSADNLIISDYANVIFTPTGFTETGFLSVTSAQLGATTFQPAGLNSAYGLYIAFSGTGVNTLGLPAGVNAGTFSALSYTLYGYNGVGSFTPTSAPVPFVKLATGALDTSKVSTFAGTSVAGQVTTANANANLTFSIEPGKQGFFGSPTSFYTLAQSVFGNTQSTIAMTSTGITVSQGGGAVNFVAAPIPEPETYALLLAGLGAVGFMARRRKTAN